jgi:hypothetical protein
MIACIVFFFSAYGIGKFALAKLRLPVEGIIENGVISFAAGLGIWCYILFILGHAGLFYKWILLGMALATAPSGVLYAIPSFREYPWKNLFVRPSLYVSILSAAAAGILTLTFISCFSPVVGGITNDEITTHLSVPNDWLIHHKICLLPYAVSHLAGNIELLFLWCMAFAPQYGPKLFSWTCYFMCVLMVYAFAKNKMPRRFAFYAGLFAAINPLIFRESCTAFIDLPAALFNFSALWSLFKYNETKNIRFTLLSAFFMGVGCGAKPSNYFYIPAFLIVLSLFFFIRKERGPAILKKLSIMAALIALFGAPWPVRNLILTGSPTFPPPLALYSVNHDRPFYFSGKPFTKENALDIYAYYRTRIRQHGMGFVNFMILPWNITMYPESFSIGDSMGVVMLSFLPLVFVFRKRPLWVNFSLVFCGIAVACIYFCIIPEARYFIPAYLAACPAAAWAIERLLPMRRVSTLVRLVIISNALFSLFIAGRVCLSMCKASLSREYRISYCRNKTPFYEAFAFLNKEKPENLFVFYGSQLWYYLKTPYCIRENALDAMSWVPGAYLLDIDYSQTLERNPRVLKNAYCIQEAPAYLTLVFSGPDARVYRFR